MKAFLRKYNIKLVVKNKSNFMKAAGLVQKLFSRISYKEFMNSYTSTIGNTIYGKEDWIERIKNGTADCDDVALLIHETAHTRQFRDGSYTRYVRSGGRALLEAQAIVAANRFRIACGDAANVKTRPQIIAQLMKYGCKFQDAVAATNIVEIATKSPISDWPMYVLDAVTEFSK
jgi:hypothetical protein